MGDIESWATWLFLFIAWMLISGVAASVWLRRATGGAPEQYKRPASPTGCQVLKLHHAAARRDQRTILNDEADEVWHQGPSAWRGR